MKCANNPILTLLIPQSIQIQDNSSRHLKYHVGRPNRGQWSQKTPSKLLGLDWKVPAYVQKCHWYFGANSLDACFLWWRSSYNCWFELNDGTQAVEDSLCATKGSLFLLFPPPLMGTWTHERPVWAQAFLWLHTIRQLSKRTTIWPPACWEEDMWSTGWNLSFGRLRLYIGLDQYMDQYMWKYIYLLS